MSSAIFANQCLVLQPKHQELESPHPGLVETLQTSVGPMTWGL